MFKKNSPNKNEANTGCVRETPQIKNNNKKARVGYVRETPHRKVNPAWDV